MAQSLNALAVGALVKDTGTLYNGKPIIWKIADKGHTGYPSGAVTLITERIISLKCFDAIESGNSDGNRRSYGNNRWTLSNVRQWLNSQAAAGKWYSAQHSADAAPTNANVWSNYNEYDAEAGFLAGFSANFVAALLSTTHTVGKASVDGGGTESCTDKIFLATCTEVGLSGDVTAGSKLALFSDNNSRSCLPHGGSREQERIHGRKFQRKFAVVLVACRRLRVLLFRRPLRRFLWRDGLGLRLQRQQRRSPAL